MFKVNKLKISGFKSFAFPTELVIGNGVTGIIGPNGCGKSNIFEAIKWVMGESSSKSLRSNSMDDVIFSGTEKIPAKNFAEVSLEIESLQKNQDFMDGEKILISRTLERGVGSFYKINNKEVRAKDIQILFSDSGSGSRSSSIISQGNIDQIINFKPIDRKVILEEAAGISGLYNRRHESELKLNATQQNLERLSDLLQELENQQSSLQRQARQAAKYQIISNKIKENEALIFNKEWQEINKKYKNSKENYSDKNHELEELEKKYKHHEETKILKNQEIKILEKKIYEVEKTKQEKELDKKNLLDKKIVTENRRNELINYIGLLSKDKQLEEKRLTEILQNISNVEKKLESFSQLKDLKININEEKKKEFLLQEKLKTSELNLVNEMQLLLGEEFRLDNLKETKENFQLKKKKISEDIKLIEEKIKKYDNIKFEKDSKFLLRKQNEIEEKINFYNKKNSLLRNDKNKLNILISSIKNEIEKLQKAFTEYNAELLTLTKLSEKNEISKDSFFNFIKIKKGYEKSVYAILKEELDSTSKSSKKRWINLKKKINTIQNPILKYVQTPKELELILSQVMIVENEEEGLRQQQNLSVGQYAVNKEGTYWRWDGFISEIDEKKDLIYSSKARMSELKPLICDIEMKLEKKISEKKKLDISFNQLNKHEYENKSKMDEEYKELKILFKNIQELKDENFQKKNIYEKLNEKLKFLKEEYNLIKNELEKIKSNEDLRNNKVPNENLKKSSTEDLILKIKEEIQNKRNSISEINEKILNLEINFKFLKNDLEQNKKRKKECVIQINNFKLREENYKKEEEKLFKFPKELEEKLILLEKRLSEIDFKSIQLEQNLNLKKDELFTHEKTERNYFDKKELLKDTIIRTEENLNYLSEKKQSLINVIFQQFKCHPDEISRNINLISNENISIEDIKKNLEKLKFQREQMGPVNLRAEMEENEISQKIENLVMEKNDLSQALDKLKLAISKINNEGKKKLQAAFKQVDQNFSELFIKLFDGGEASLKLVSSDDPLKTGLEIFARPPGKKLTSINLLSGGEKTLTAISLIFSIFLINPSPICILDEVDAALDDVNVDKFCKLLNEIKKNLETRFLIISHHKTTMSMIDRVYGVTMSQRGISDIVSVNFSSQRLKEAI